MDEKKRDMEEYLSDLKEIKKMMDQSEDEGIMEVWVYWVYSAAVLAGSVISYYLDLAGGHTRFNIFVLVWIPLLFMCMIIESLGWIRRMGKRNFPLFSRRIVKSFSVFIGLFTIFSVMLGLLLKVGVSYPGIYLMTGAVPLFLYALISYTSMLVEGWVLTGGGILFLVNGINSLNASLAAGIIVAVVYCLLGFHILYLERTSNG
jgi:hypothetical protein